MSGTAPASLYLLFFAGQSAVLRRIALFPCPKALRLIVIALDSKHQVNGSDWRKLSLLDNRHIVAITLKLHISGFVKKQDHRLEQHSCSSRSSLQSRNPQNAACFQILTWPKESNTNHGTDCLYALIPARDRESTMTEHQTPLKDWRRLQ